MITLAYKNIDLLNTALHNDTLPITVRKLLSRINTCVFYYGKYIEAFKPTTLSYYSLSRVIMKEDVEGSEIVNKEDIDGLMEQLLSLQNPFACLHGKPIAIKMSKYDIERKFARK